MRLKRVQGKAIILRDNGSPDILDVIVVPNNVDDQLTEHLVHAACVDNDTSTDDVVVDTVDHYYIVKDTRNPVVRYEFNPRQKRTGPTKSKIAKRPKKELPRNVSPKGG